MFILLIHGVSAEDQTLGTLTKDACVNVIQTCGNCTYVNITAYVIDNSTYIYNPPQVMTKTGTFYNYTFCLTSKLGHYIINGDGNPDGIVTPWKFDFDISNNGYELSVEQAILYLFALIVMMTITGFTLYLSIVTPWENDRNEYQEIIAINRKKYLKLFSIAMTYLFVLVIVSITHAITFGYLQLTGISGVFGAVRDIMFYGLFVMIPIIILIGAYSIFNDKNLTKLFNMGVSAVNG